MNFANQTPPSSRVDLMSTKLVWALMPIPVIVALSGLIDLHQQAAIAPPPPTTYSASSPTPQVTAVDAIGNVGSRNSDEVQYFQERATQLRGTLSE